MSYFPISLNSRRERVMSRKQKRIWWLLFAVIALAAIAVAFVEGHGRLNSVRPADDSETTQVEQIQAPQTQRPSARNLSLQPQAFNVGRKLGKRFAGNQREKSVIVGTLTVGAERRTVQTIRKQSTNGEQVDISVAGSLGLLTRNAGQGAKSAGARANGSDLELIERLVFDSADQFVLAQLRGASYYTVARDVRPESKDEPDGTLWDIVRVDDPEQDELKRPRSRWRLYYLNTTTGMIDRIESELQGERVIAEIRWSEVAGEKVPAQVTWKRQGQILMQYRLISFTHASA